MKKKLAGLLTAFLVLAMGTTAFAAGSSNTSNVTDTNKPSSQQQAVLSANAEIAGQVVSPTDGISVAVPEGVYGAQVIVASQIVASQVDADAQVMAVVEVSGAIPADGLVTFTVPGVQAGDNMAILHLTGSGWELIPVEAVGNGMITGRFTSFSPVAFVKLPKPLAGPVQGTTPGAFQAGQQSGTSTTSAVGSPKTGSACSVLPILAMLCAAGIIVCGKKAIYNA